MRVRLRCGRFRMLSGFFQVTGAENWNGSQRRAPVSGRGTEGSWVGSRSVSAVLGVHGSRAGGEGFEVDACGAGHFVLLEGRVGDGFLGHGEQHGFAGQVVEVLDVGG